jgi:hypothetical protein
MQIFLSNGRAESEGGVLGWPSATVIGSDVYDAAGHSPDLDEIES